MQRTRTIVRSNPGQRLWHTILLGVLSLLAARAIAGTLTANDLAWLGETRFMAYTPSGFRVLHGRPIPAMPESIAEDLRVLRPYADGLITYSAANGLAEIVGLAEEAGFRAMILGIWSPADEQEVATAVSVARQHPQLVRAIAVGNEGLFWERYRWQDVQKVMKQLRRELPGVAVTTSEPMVSYLGTPARLGCEDQDFLLPNIHPIFESWFSPTSLAQATAFVLDIERRLYNLCKKFVLIKETGVPSGPAAEGFTQAGQRAFWRDLLDEMRTEPHAALALFEAFDAPWKIDEIARDSGHRDEREAAWGWFTDDRQPKAVVDLLAAHPSASGQTGVRAPIAGQARQKP